MRVRDAEHYAKRLLHHYNLTARGWSIHWGTAIRRAGWCSVKIVGDTVIKRITFSRPAVQINPMRLVAPMIAHEVAHALCWERGYGLRHDAAWMGVACMIGGPDAAIVRTAMQAPKGKYQYQCRECKTMTGRSRRLKYGYELGCVPCRKTRGVWVRLREMEVS